MSLGAPLVAARSATGAQLNKSHGQSNPFIGDGSAVMILDPVHPLFERQTSSTPRWPKGQQVRCQWIKGSHLPDVDGTTNWWFPSANFVCAVGGTAPNNWYLPDAYHPDRMELSIPHDYDPLMLCYEYPLSSLVIPYHRATTPSSSGHLQRGCHEDLPKGAFLSQKWWIEWPALG